MSNTKCLAGFNVKDEVSPWVEAFVNAKKWIENK